MTRMKRLTLVLALPCWVVGCGDDTTGDSRLTGSETATSGDGDGDASETGTATGDGDGDGDSSGDGDGDSGDGDGDGDGDTNGDGDGDGDGDSGDGDGDGDGDSGDGDGDGDSGDGDGDGDTGDGDGDGDGDTTGDGDGDGDTTGDGDGDGDGQGDSGDACDEFQVTLDPLPPNVMLVLDKSRSMFINLWDHDNNNNTATITRWNSLYQVVDNVVTTFDSQINFGAVLFPSTAAQNVYGPAACITEDFPECNVLPNNGANILATIPGPLVVNSYGGTPAATGIQTAYDHLMNLDPNTPRVMILVTDGAANCSQDAQNNNELFEVYDDNLPFIVGQAHDDGIDTYVVGVDLANMVVNDGVGGDPNGINPTVVLTAVAQAGGTGVFINSQDQIELDNALTNVIESVKTCTIPLDVPPFFPEFTKVFVDNMEWPMVNDCVNEDGWVYTNPNGPYDSIELCGAACDALKIVGEADIEYHCNPG
jgi:hypothetical protein